MSAQPGDDQAQQPDDLMTVYVTAPSHDEAMHIATLLVNSGLVACANVLPRMESVYRYDGTLQLDNEVAMLMKTARAQVDAVITAITEVHSYDVPCITVWEIAASAPLYKEWAVGQVLPDDTLKTAS